MDQELPPRPHPASHVRWPTQLGSQSYIWCSQGSILCPLLVLIYTNDLPECISSSTPQLFADYCVLYQQITSAQDCTSLQKDTSGRTSTHFRNGGGHGSWSSTDLNARSSGLPTKGNLLLGHIQSMDIIWKWSTRPNTSVCISTPSSPSTPILM